MIASSTTIPSTTMNANSEIRLTETSFQGMKITAPRNEIGMPSDTQPARRSLKKSDSTSSTSAKPARPLRVSSSRRLRSTSVSSRQESSEMPSGILG